MRLFFLIIIVMFITITPFADNKSDSNDLYNKGNEEYLAGNLDEAIADLEKAISLDDRNFKAVKLLVEVLDKKGQSLIKEKNYDEALAIYKKAYKLWPDNSQIKDTYKKLQDGSIQDSNNNEVITKLKDADDKLKEIKETKLDKNNSENDPEKTKILEEELNKQKVLIEKLKKEYEKKDNKLKEFTTIKLDEKSKENETLAVDNLLKLYKEILEKGQDNEKMTMELYTDQMKEYRLLIEKQRTSTRNLIIITISSFFGFILLILLVFIILLKFMQKRRTQQQKYASYMYEYGIPPSQILPDNKSTFLLENNIIKEQPVNQVKEISETDSDVYKDLMKFEKLKNLSDQIKNGSLHWQTVRECISDIEKDLRGQIINLVEEKLESGKFVDYSSILEILFPFLTEGDDYLRSKSNILAEKIVNNIKIEKNKDISKKEHGSDELKDISNIQALQNIANELDEITGRKEHNVGVARLSKGIGMVLGYSKEDLDLLYAAGLVHDFGYYMLDREKIITIMNKKDELTEEEHQYLRKHPETGIDFFKERKIKLPQEVKDGILYHHERRDGTGYPKGLKGDDIPEFARVLAIADSYNAIITIRGYRDKFNTDSAVVIIKDLGKKKFDLKYIDALFEYLKKSKI